MIFSECLWENVSSVVSISPAPCGFSVSYCLTGPEKNPGLRKDQSSELSLRIVDAALQLCEQGLLKQGRTDMFLK